MTRIGGGFGLDKSFMVEEDERPRFGCRGPERITLSLFKVSRGVGLWPSVRRPEYERDASSSSK